MRLTMGTVVSALERIGNGPDTTGRALLILAAMAALVFFSGITAPLPYVNSEQRNGEIAATMYSTGDMLVPRLEGKPHLTKPPLFHWLSYAVSCVRGKGGLLSARAVSAAGAMATILLTYLLGSRLLDSQVAWYGACLLFSSLLLFVHHGHRGTFDTTLTAFILLAFYGYASLTGERPVRAKILLVLGLAGGFLVKGPIAWILPGVPMAIDSLSRRGTRRTLRGGSLLALGVLLLSLPWYVVLVLRVPEARQVFADALRVNFGGRSEVYDMAFHREPFHFYLWQFPLLMLPWAMFLLALRPRSAWVRIRDPKQPGRLLLHSLLWALLFLTLIPAKAPRYLVPLAPLFCLLFGQWFAGLRDCSPDELPWLRRLWYTQTVLLAVGTVGVPVLLWVRLGEPAPVWVAVGMPLALFAVVGWRWRQRVTVPLFLGAALLLTLLLVPVAYQRWIPHTHYIHEMKHSAARQAYKVRAARLSQFFAGTKPPRP
jgi:4-amino-4-deoxy-L-arabinose transferase